MSNTFFTEPFVHLHDIVLDFLAVDPTIHAALPLLGVNRHWRSLTVQRLVREFQRTKLDKLEFDERTYLPKLTLSEGSYLKAGRFCSFYLPAPSNALEHHPQLHQSTLCPQEGAHKCDDPRYSLARGHPGSEMILLLCALFNSPRSQLTITIADLTSTPRLSSARSPPPVRTTRTRTTLSSSYSATACPLMRMARSGPTLR